MKSLKTIAVMIIAMAVLVTAVPTYAQQRDHGRNGAGYSRGHVQNHNRNVNHGRYRDGNINHRGQDRRVYRDRSNHGRSYHGRSYHGRGYYGRGYHGRGYYGRGYYGRGYYGRGYYGAGYRSYPWRPYYRPYYGSYYRPYYAPYVSFPYPYFPSFFLPGLSFYIGF